MRTIKAITHAFVGLSLAALWAVAPASADDVGGAGEATSVEALLLDRIEQLEQRIDDLESNQPDTSAADTGAASWTRRVRLGGSANAGFYGGGNDSVFDPDSFQIFDARFFVDADLGREIAVGEQTVFRNVAFSFEWDLVRVGMLKNDVGELFVDFQGIFDQNWLNLQLGRFHVPVGEAYLRYAQGYASKPFITSAVGGPWYWDEGLRFYGSDREHEYGYVMSISDGDTPFNVDSDSDKQFTLKLFWQPLDWLYVSASGLRSGTLGNKNKPASGALWLGETWMRSLGSGSGVAVYQDGAPIADGPNVIHDTWLAAGDVILEWQDKGRMWFAYGYYGIDSTGGATYDRDVHYWIAEAVVRGAWASETLRPFYLGVRANAIATYDDDRGYLLDFRYGSNVGYNMKSLTAISTVLGWELNSHLRVRAEYTHTDIDLVDGVSSAIRNAARDADSYGIEVGASF